MATAASSSTPAPPAGVEGFGHETINDFLDRQPQQTLVRLYQRPCNALAVFRLLTAMARQLIMHLLFLPGPLPTDQYKPWVRKGEGSRAHDAALARLQRLHILRETGGSLVLSAVFQESLQRALVGGGDHRSFGVAVGRDALASADHDIDVAFLDDYARRSWEGILHYMVGSEGVQAPREAVLFLLRQSNLMRRLNGDDDEDDDSARRQQQSRRASPQSLGITARGFQFLLEDLNTQLWDILLQYLALASARRMDLVEVLSLLFMLGSLTLGQAYSTQDLSPTQLHCLDDLRDYGLVYQPNNAAASSACFWPTRLATTLTNHDAASAVQTLRNTDAESGGASGGKTGPDSSSSSGSSPEPRGFIVLETNYRLYAYTSNPLRIAVLQLFTSIRARFPNLVVGVITRDSIKAALARGISAEQVIAYLSHHAHPQMVLAAQAHADKEAAARGGSGGGGGGTGGLPLLPITVTDQIRLWERERNRVEESQGYLYADFASAEDYRLVRDYARSLAVLLWEDENKRRCFVEARGHEPVRDFIRRRLQ